MIGSNLNNWHVKNVQGEQNSMKTENMITLNLKEKLGTLYI